jgi:hypothetical protein
MKLIFKVFALLFALLFLLAAFVQWNDPDAVLWYFVYGIPALVSLLFLFGRLSHGLAFILSIGYLVGMVFVWPEKFEGFNIGEGDIVNIEKGREAFGLLIIAVVLLVYALRIRYMRQS